MGQRWSLAAVAAIVLVGAAGCGSDDSAPLTSAEFRAQAEAICRKTNTRVEGGRFPVEVAGFRKWAIDVKAIQDEGLDQLEEVNPPKDAQPSFDELRAALSRLSDLTQTAAQRVVARDEAGVRSVNATIAEQQKAITQLATELGVRGCSST